MGQAHRLCSWSPARRTAVRGTAVFLLKRWKQHVSLGQVLFRQNNRIKSMTENSVSAEDVAKVLWQDFLPFFLSCEALPENGFWQSCSGGISSY